MLTPPPLPVQMRRRPEAADGASLMSGPYDPSLYFGGGPQMSSDTELGMSGDGYACPAEQSLENGLVSDHFGPPQVCSIDGPTSRDRPGAAGAWTRSQTQAVGGGVGAGTQEADNAPPLPTELGQEAVLAAWIARFNQSLMNSARKRQVVRQITAKGWGDASGLSLVRLKTAVVTWQSAATDQPAAAAAGQNTAPPAPVTTSRILGMLAEGKSTLLNVVTDANYHNKCLQFSRDLLKDLGAKRADGSDSMDEKTETHATTPAQKDALTQSSPLTAQFRNHPLAELGNQIPAGYQISVTSMPDWGFTEVGNHWFMSAGDGMYLDGVNGVSDGAALVGSLKSTTGDQWASRVVDSNLSGVRARMKKKFIGAFGRYAKYRGASAEGPANDAEFADANDRIQKGKAAISGFVRGNADLLPRVWTVEPTATGGGE